MPVPTLVYDGDCHFCQREARRLARLSATNLHLESFRDPRVIERHPGLTASACEQAMQFVDAGGRITSGAEAAAQILSLNPWLRWVKPIYYAPGLRPLADAAYRWVARNRFRLGGSCSGDHCKRH